MTAKPGNGEPSKSLYDEGVRIALAVAADWKLTLPEMAQLLGYKGNVGQDSKLLERELTKLHATSERDGEFLQ